jgi:hypothetical protein
MISIATGINGHRMCEINFHGIVIRHVDIFTQSDDLQNLSWHNMISIATGININWMCKIIL